MTSGHCCPILSAHCSEKTLPITFPAGMLVIQKWVYKDGGCCNPPGITKNSNLSFLCLNFRKRPGEIRMFLAFLWSKTNFTIFFRFFYRFDVYDVTVTSHGNFWCFFWLIWIQGTKNLYTGTRYNIIGSLFEKKIRGDCSNPNSLVRKRMNLKHKYLKSTKWIESTVKNT